MKERSLVGWINKGWVCFVIKVPNRKWKSFDRISHSTIYSTKKKEHKKVRITIKEV